MTALILATTNPGKIEEFKRLLMPLISVAPPPRKLSVEEDGRTYFENAQKKALVYYQEFKTPMLSDDSGLEIDILNGAPGVFSARWGGEKLSWPQRWCFALKQLEETSPEKWICQFRSVLCFYDGVEFQFFEGVTRGRLIAIPRGDAGFGYDPIFFSDTLQKTFGEATPIEKDSASHRAFAAQAFLRWWKTRGNSPPIS